MLSQRSSRRRGVWILCRAGEALCVASVAIVLAFVGLRVAAHVAMWEAALARIEQAAR